MPHDYTGVPKNPPLLFIGIYYMPATCPACGHPFSCMQHGNSSERKCIKCNPLPKLTIDRAQCVRDLGVELVEVYRGQWQVTLDGVTTWACWYGSRDQAARVRLLVKPRQRLPWVSAKGKCVRGPRQKWCDMECHPECVGPRIAQEINRRMWEKYMKSW